MENFATENHILRLDKYCNELAVYKKVKAYDLNLKEVKVEVENDEFQLTEENCGTCHKEEFTIGKFVFTRFEENEFIGAADIRDMRMSTYTYNMDTCPVYFKKDGGLLMVSTECSANCDAPKTGCREEVVRECDCE